MTVQKLIKRLQKYDPKTRVVIRGYEGGVDDVIRVSKVKVDLNVYDEWYYGRHEINTKGDTPAIELVGGDE